MWREIILLVLLSMIVARDLGVGISNKRGLMSPLLSGLAFQERDDRVRVRLAIAKYDVSQYCAEM